MTECVKSAIILDGEISKCVDLTRICPRMYEFTHSFQVSIDDLVSAIQAAKQRVKISNDMISGLMFAYDFLAISGTAEGLWIQIKKALEYTRTWRVTTNVSKCAALVCDEGIEILSGGKSKCNLRPCCVPLLTSAAEPTFSKNPAFTCQASSESRISYSQRDLSSPPKEPDLNKLLGIADHPGNARHSR